MAGIQDNLTRLALARARLAKLLEEARLGRGLQPAPRTPSPFREVTGFGSNPGNLRMLTHRPQSLGPRAPLVVALHGCTQDAAGYDHGSGWSALAERHGFALLMPEQQRSNNPNACFSWFLTSDVRRGHGEALSIRQMIDHMLAADGLDPARVFVAGLSAGGAMTGVMLATYPEVFAGGAIIAGLPYGSAASVQEALTAMAQPPDHPARHWSDHVLTASPHRGPWPRLSVWHGSADGVVNAANAEQIIKQWTHVHGLAQAPSHEHGLAGHRRRVWRGSGGADVIEAVTVSGMGHGVPIAPADPDDGCGSVDAHHFDVGLSSGGQIVRFWGIAADGAAARPDHAGAPAAPAAAIGSAGMAAAAAAAAAASQSAAQLDPDAAYRDIIADALRRSGLAVPEGATLAPHDHRAIIAASLRAAGLLKEPKDS